MVNKVPEVSRDNLLNPGEAGPEVNHLLEARHFIFQNKREKTVKQEQEIVLKAYLLCDCRPQEEVRKIE
jgi:hypothetical protein